MKIIIRKQGEQNFVATLEDCAISANGKTWEEVFENIRKNINKYVNDYYNNKGQFPEFSKSQEVEIINYVPVEDFLK